MNLSKRLKDSRSGLGLTLSEVEQKTGIATSSLSEFENGGREPSISQVSKLARCYNRPFSFFFSDETPHDPQVLWRQRPENRIALDQERRFLKLCEQYRHLEIWCNDTIEPELPQVHGHHETFGYADAENIARRVRQELNLGNRPAWGLRQALENDCGIKIFHDTFEPTGTAACVRSDQFGMAILLNSGNAPQRRNFDLAHELFHLLVWNIFRLPNETTSTVADETEEKFANAFASYLLLPTEALEKAVQRRLDDKASLAVSALPRIAQEFGVSVDALMWRIHRAYNFGDACKEHTKQVIEAAKRLENNIHDMDIFSPPQKYPERYRALAIRALITGEMSTGKFMDFMEVSRREAMNYLRSEEESVAPIQIIAR